MIDKRVSLEEGKIGYSTLSLEIAVFLFFEAEVITLFSVLLRSELHHT